MAKAIAHPDDKIIGKRVRIKRCIAEFHDSDNPSCVCHLIGRIVVIAGRDTSQYPAVPQYTMLDYGNWFVRRSEVVLLRKQSPVRQLEKSQKKKKERGRS